MILKECYSAFKLASMIGVGLKQNGNVWLNYCLLTVHPALQKGENPLNPH